MEDFELAVVVPDYKLGATLKADQPGSFFDRLLGSVPRNTLIVPLLNGERFERLTCDFEQVGMPKLLNHETMKRELHPHIHPEIYDGEGGLLGALMKGYEMFTYNGKEQYPIVRLDTAEHPPEKIDQLLLQMRALRCDMVIGDLVFPKEPKYMLTPDSLDERVHLYEFPKLYRDASNNRLALSCAHGFQAFRNAEVLTRAFTKALDIYSAAQKKMGDKPITWGMDGMMALGALAAGLHVTVSQVPAEMPRNRPEQKVRQQLSQAQMLCSTFKELHDT